jgi:hypothetical protein
VTEQPQGRDGSPSVAVLAVQVNELRQGAKSLRATVDVLSKTQREHSVVVDGIGELRRQVDRILDLLSEEEESTRPWFWLTMPEQEREEKFSEMSDWMETVLRSQYPGYLTDQIRPCWPHHPEATWELAWLYQLWSAAYLGKRAMLKDAADWHDRWAPGVIRRLGHVMEPCERVCLQRRGAEPKELRGPPH